ncbi:MAG: hypothetical protein Q8R47_03125 [Nanoarchaeota archaeon]|nr:hypothetical protein [Nanoarchaeota archaeon]
MSLESLLKPLRWADEQVLRQYTKQAEAWEEKGRSKYSLAHLYNLTATAANCSFMLLGDLYFALGTGILALQSLDLASNVVGQREETKTISDAIAKPSASYEITRKVSSLARLPMLVTGIGLMIKGMAHLVDYVQTKNPESAINSLYMCSFGYALIGTASSMYIKDSDPKLLEKKPLEEFNLQLQPVSARVRKK